jgi:hypothetical protein
VPWRRVSSKNATRGLGRADDAGFLTTGLRTRSVVTYMSLPSFVSIVDRCDNFRREATSDHFAEFRLTFDSKHVLGLIPDDVLNALRAANHASSSASQPPVWDIRDTPQAGIIS